MKQFGETVTGYSIPVLNEREIRGAAGMLFLLTIVAFARILAAGDFVFIKYFITIFMIEMAIRVFINPKFAPFMTISRFMVRNQTPLYVGASQKRFAWIIGLTLSSIMFIHMVILNAYGVVNGLTCLICMLLMFFEVTFGICIGCKIYGFFNKGKVLHCPGEVCEIKDRHEIQKTTWAQFLIVIVFIALIALMYFTLNDTLSIKPHELGK